MQRATGSLFADLRGHYPETNRTMRRLWAWYSQSLVRLNNTKKKKLFIFSYFPYKRESSLLRKHRVK